MKEADPVSREFIFGLPKAELHIHIEGSLEPELMLLLADRNGIDLPYGSAEEVRAAYEFTDLQSFLDIYYAGASVLVTEQDFHDLTVEYIERSRAQGLRHAEIFFDPQTHTDRGVAFSTVLEGIHGALQEAHERHGVSSRLILCFLRHLSAADAMRTLEEALPFKDRIIGVGLDSSELGHPPQKFKAVFDQARAEGFLTVAHAGEEGPPEYIRQALDLLEVERIDHGVRCLEDAELVARLAREGIPLTVCPLSNVKLRVFDTMADHNLTELRARGLVVTVNSDDPAYFGGYIGDNFVALREMFGLGREELIALARASFESSFLEPEERHGHLAALDDYARA